jgi:hypothetical protein
METIRKKELKKQAKEESPIAGILQVTNIENGKVFIDAVNNIKRLNGFDLSIEFRNTIK